MTIKQAKQIASEKGFSLKKVEGEFIVKEKASGHEYFTNCINDAIATIENWK